jgi:flagellar protein FliO/FliZ
LKRYGIGGRLHAAGAGKRLSLVEMAPIDGKRRLVLVRRDDTEHLLLLGLSGELVVESGIRGGQGGAAAGDRRGEAPVRPVAAARGEAS